MLHAGSYVPFASHLDLVARQSLAGIQPSKRIPYTKSKYIQRIPLEQILFCTPWERGRNTMAGVREGFAPWESQVYQLAPLRPPLRVSPLAQGGGGKRPPLSAVHPKKKGNAIRQRTYSKASPLGVASLSTCSAEAAPSGQPARARGRRITPPLSAVHPKKKGNAIRQRTYSKASPPGSRKGG